MGVIEHAAADRAHPGPSQGVMGPEIPCQAGGNGIQSDLGHILRPGESGTTQAITRRLVTLTNNPLLLRRLKRILIAFVLFLLFSISGYVLVEGYSLDEAAYMTVITLSTVGFSEVRPLSSAGRILTMVVILSGLGMVAFLASSVGEYLIAGQLAGTLKQRRIMKTIERLQNHYIVCGYGRIGEQVAKGLRARDVPVVVVENEKTALLQCERSGLPFVAGDAEDDEVLRQAGIERARGLVAALNSDASNVFLVLSARFLSPDLLIVARATCRDADLKLQKAGADRVVSPYQIAGHRIVNRLTRPHVTSFLDGTMRDDLELLLEEVVVSPQSSLVGQTMEEAELRTGTGANVLSIMRGAEQRVVDWSPDLRVEADDILIVLGRKEQLKAVAQLADDSRFG